MLITLIALTVALFIVLNLFALTIKVMAKTGCPLTTWMGFDLLKGLGSLIVAILSAIAESSKG